MRKELLLLSLLGCISIGFSQNVVVDETTYTVEELVTDILIDSPCANVSNITWSTGTDFGSVNGIAFFEEPLGAFPFDQGLVMSAGGVTLANGPNTAFNQSLGNAWPGDADLSVLAGAATNNASIIEFDFVPIATEISFRFLMASEEYSPPGDGAVEYECNFSDVFAFFLTDADGVTENLAVLPDTNIPILVTTVHPDNGASCGGANPQFFSQYVPLGSPPTGYDGFTRSFTAMATVNPGETYHIKLAVADAVDTIVHSAVFLEAGSFDLGLDLGEDLLITSGNAKCEGDTVTLDTGSPTATHTWYKDGIELVGETGSTLDVTDPGEYSVDVVFSGSCQSFDSIIIEFVTNPIANPALDQTKCDGIFDLTLNDDDILGTQNPADFIITYHESQAEADTGANPLISPYNNLTNPQTIFARIESVSNPDCYDTTTFEINVDVVTFADPIADMVLCDPDNDGFELFTLTDQDVSIATSAGYAPADVTITYHESQADADIGGNPLGSPYANLSSPQTIYVKLVDNLSPTCTATTTFDLIVNSTPEVVDITLEQCDEDGVPDGLTEYNLNQAVPGILVSGDPTGLSFSYYLSFADADAALNPVAPSPFTNTVNPQIVYVRVEDDNSGCYSIAELTLDVTATDVGDVSLETCDDDYDGFSEFDLSDADALILASLPPGLTVAYYETAGDAQLEENPLPNLYTNTIPSLQTVYIRVEDANNCYGIATMDLIVNPLPDNNTVNDREFCSDSTDIGSIDLSVFDSEVLGVQLPADYTISYHETQADADSGINALVSPYTNTTNPQTIYVRVENNSTGCVMAFINFDIGINPNPALTVPTALEVCDDNVIDGLTEIDLSIKNSEISGSNPDYSVSYHETQGDADLGINPLPIPYTNLTNPQIIYARGEDINTGCYSTVALELMVEQAPLANTPPPFEFCDPDADGFGEFVLTDLDVVITGGVPGLTVSYHETLTNAENDVNALSSPYSNIVVNTQTLYARVESATIATDCATIVEVVLVVNPEPQIADPEPLAVCDDNTDELAQFDLTLIETQTLNGLDPLLYTISYYETEANAQSGTNAIGVATAYTNLSNPQTLWVRVEDNATGCYKARPLELIVNPLPVLVQPSALELCDANNPGDETEAFTLEASAEEILNGQTGINISFYATQGDADTALNAITSPYTNLSNPQTIFVRGEVDATGCYSVVTLDLRVNPVPTPGPDPADLFLCDVTDPGDGIEIFDLTQNETYIINGEANVSATYHESLEDAEAGENAILDPAQYSNTAMVQTIWVRVTNTITGCYSIVSFEIEVGALPELTAVADDIACEIGTDGFYEFDLQGNDDTILNGQDPSVYQVSYHLSPADAEAGVAALASLYVNITNPQTIYVRVTNIVTGCYNTGVSFMIEVQEGAQANSDGIAIVYNQCDDNMETDGDPSNDSVLFDLSSQDDQVLDGQDPASYTVSYYATLEEAELGVNALPNSYENTSNPQLIYARVDNDTTADAICYAVTSLTLVVDPLPLFDLDERYILCVDTNGTEVISPPVLDTGLSGAEYSFIWQLGGSDIPGATGSSYAPTQGGSYSVLVTDLITGCQSSDSTTVIESSPPAVTAQVTSLAFADDHVIEATATGTGVYEYSLDDGPWQESGIFTGVSGGIHVVKARDLNGCGIGLAEVLVIDYPKFFTPNGDGYHDTWNIIGIGTQPDAKIYIFDRYGKLLKQLSPLGSGWNGTYNGALMPSADYWFVVTYTEPGINVKKEFRAHFSLKR
ncbi:MAG: T9SS type B sorting domain-containing protein [Flavobacteriaceae bacterium]|nr:T9SS type B sorting domain-containing protein [Flavobacteriaceae bacterium]